MLMILSFVIVYRQMSEEEASVHIRVRSQNTDDHPCADQHAGPPPPKRCRRKSSRDVEASLQMLPPVSSLCERGPVNKSASWHTTDTGQSAELQPPWAAGSYNSPFRVSRDDMSPMRYGKHHSRAHLLHHLDNQPETPSGSSSAFHTGPPQTYPYQHSRPHRGQHQLDVSAPIQQQGLLYQVASASNIPGADEIESTSPTATISRSSGMGLHLKCSQYIPFKLVYSHCKMFSVLTI